MKAKSKILAILLLAIVISIAIKLLLPSPEQNKALVDEFWISKTHANNRNNVVFGGDSRIYRGISTKAFTKEFNDKITAYNFGYSSAGFSKNYLNFLETKLDSSANLKVIVLGITPHSLTPNGLLNEDLEIFTNISNFKKYQGLYLSPILKHFSPYQPSELKNSFFNEEIPNYYQQKYNPDGWVASNKIPGDTSEAIISYISVFNKNKVSESAINNLAQQVNYWSNKGILVVGFRPPTTSEMRNLEDSISGFNEELTIKLFKQAGGVWVELDSHQFKSYDGSHLRKESAEELSEILGKEVVKALQ
jgi:hypothetical protein